MPGIFLPGRQRHLPNDLLQSPAHGVPDETKWYRIGGGYSAEKRFGRMRWTAKKQREDDDDVDPYEDRGEEEAVLGTAHRGD